MIKDRVSMSDVSEMKMQIEKAEGRGDFVSVNHRVT